MDDMAAAPEAPSVEQLTRVYIRMRDAREALKQRYDEEDAKIGAAMDQVKAALLEHCKEHNVDSFLTPAGRVIRTVKKRFWTNDWSAMHAFILEHRAPDLLEKRLHQTAMQQFLEENPDVLPPGLNVDSAYSITVKRK